MKKIITIKIVLIFFIPKICFANSLDENFKFNFDNEETKVINFAKESKFKDIGTIDSNLRISHAVFAGVTYASLWALDATGIALLYHAFTNPNSNNYDALKYSHIGISIFALLTFSTTVILAFTKLGIKLKNKFEIRKTHLTAAIVTLSFYIIEVSSIILTSIFFWNKLEGTKWVGLAHGITCGLTTLAFSISFITIFF